MTLFNVKPSLIFQDAGWLQPLSEPPSGKPIHRERELETMAALLSDVFRVGRARNLFVYGKPGTGKTLCIRYVVNEVNRHAEASGAPVAAVYVNAGWTRTPYYTIREILGGLGLRVPESGWQMFRLKNAFEKFLVGKAAVIAIDEVDVLLRKEREPLVYYLNRQPKTTLILASNRFEEFTDLPERVVSTLQPKIINLKPYTKLEAYKILRERAEHAFQPEAYSEDALQLVAKVVELMRDIRMGFAILLTAGSYAEKAGRTKISMKDVASAIENEAEKELIRRKLSRLLKKRGMKIPEGLEILGENERSVDA